jgi:hypothetical protein
MVDFNNEINILLYDQKKIVTYRLLNYKYNITPLEARKYKKNE